MIPKKILKFNFEKSRINDNQALLSDTIRMALNQEEEVLFDLLDYEKDTIFLEPSLFCFFLSDIDIKDKISLVQSIYGYIEEGKQPHTISVKADCFGLVNLPNLGYLKMNPNVHILLKSDYIKQNVIKNQFIVNTNIRLSLHLTDVLEHKEGIIFHETVENLLQKYKYQLSEAVNFLQKYLSEFWQLIDCVCREFVVFSSPNHNSFAGIRQHGTAYFNVENGHKSMVFFIDDITHQCGHIIFNSLTLQTNEYLKVHKEYSLKNHSSSSNEIRGAYGVFHGLFTYTCILNALDKFLDIEKVFSFSNVLKHEAIGRIGFYIKKFSKDLSLMNNPEILTEEGLNYHRQFTEGFDFIFKKYNSLVVNFNYSNQPYTFQYKLFQELNPF